MIRGKKQIPMMMAVMLVFVLGACTLPRFQPVLPPVQPPQLTQEQFIASDGVALPLRQWLPQKQPTKAVIIALHGFNDYSNAFAGPGKYFADHGIAVLAYDQRGFGRARQPGIWGGQQNLTRDVAEMVAVTKQRYPALPLYLLGESMGGAVAIAAVTDPHFSQGQLQGIILSAPALWGGNTLNPLHRFVLWIGAHNVPEMKLTGRGLKILASDNFEMLRALGRDPLVIKQTRIDAIYGLVQLMDKAQENVPFIKSPVLLLYGCHDQVIPPKAIAGAICHTSKDFRLATYHTGWHMLLRDLQAQRVLDDILSWINHPKQPLPSAAEVKPGDFWKVFHALKTGTGGK